jgi:hypothetical protein
MIGSIPRLGIDMKDFGIEAAREAAIEKQNQTPCRDTAEPLLHKVKRDGRVVEIERIGVVRGEFVRLGPVARKGDDYSVIGIAAR